MAISLTFFTVSSQRINEYQSEFIKFFGCQAFGFNEENPCVFDLDRRDFQSYNVISYAMFALAPYVSLIYIVRVEDLKAKWKKRSEGLNATSSSHKT